jgi:hypothetical protein
MFMTPDADDWEPASINTPLDEGDALWCPEGTTAEIHLPDGGIVRLDGGSQLNLLVNEGSFMHLNLASGRLYLRTSRNSAENSLQIDADDTTVLPSSRTRLRLDMLSDGQEDVSIFKGSAYVEGNGSRTKVRAGEHIALEEGRSELLPLNSPDNWESWNLDRDRAQSNVAKAESNLPDELRSYSGELETNGSWVAVPEYGMVWRPTVVLSSDWAPYRSGRWIWRGSDYIWISSESWGWVPYHYGRWTVISNFGWCWVPPARGDVYWGPGYVGWYRTGSHVGWTPLAPGETYYGYGNHGRHSVNVSTITVNSSSVEYIEYRNRHHRGGLTVLPQNDFLRGRVATVQPVLNSSVSVSVSLGSPRIRPSKEIRTSAGNHAPILQAAPRREHQNIRELRQRFPRVTPEPSLRQKSQQIAPVTSPRQRQQSPRVDSIPEKNKQATPVTIPQQKEQSQRVDAPPVVQQQSNIRVEDKSRREAEPVSRQSSQQATSVPAPQQREQSQRVDSPSAAQPQSNPPLAEKSRQGSSERAQKLKKVWRVRAVENGKEAAPKVIEQKNRERRERQ